MEKTLFYVFGIALVVSALAVSAVGLRRPDFPGSRGILAAVVAYFAVLVAATTTFAVLQANTNTEERTHNEEAAAKAHEAEAQLASGTTTSTTSVAETTTSTTTAPSGAETTVKLAADPSGQLAFEQKSLSAKAGSVTIDFDNSSPVGHDVCVESPAGDEVGCSDIITGSSTSLTEDLQAGKYTFYCSVPGHREAGMEGPLTVK